MDRELLTEQVLRCVEAVPPGRVTTYGDIAAVIGSGPRVVGAMMSGSGDVAWWRVVNASGRLPEHLVEEASRHWQEESTPMAGPGRVSARARFDRQELAERVQDRLAELSQSPTRRSVTTGAVGQSSHG